MNLNDLPASELAKIDSVCLDYELRFRRGESPSIEEIVAAYQGDYRDLLRQELEAVRNELSSQAKFAISDETRLPPHFRVPPPGTKIGPYMVGETIGRGGMGVVLKAIDLRLQRPVAIKVLAAEIARHDDLHERFKRESRSVASLSHPNIIELFDVGSFDGLPFAVMEYLDGELLSDRLHRGRMSIDEVRQLGAQIADALALAHKSGVIHRDLKPQNIMINPSSGFVKIFDFGLSRATPLPNGTDRVPAADIDDTQEGIILGTPGYMAPEQIVGQPATAAADIFALGCILHEAFYGHRAFDGDSKWMRHQATLSNHPQPDPIRRSQDPELATLIDQCLAKEPPHRPASAALIAAQLRDHETESARVAKTMVAGEAVGRFTRRRMMEIAAGGLSGAVVAAYVAWQYPNPLAGIRALGVLSFDDDSATITNGQSESWTTAAARPQPLGSAPLRPGEMMAALLVHELIEVPGMLVPPYRPLVATNPSEYQQIGEMLQVDALLAGTIRTEIQGHKKFLVLDVRIVSATDGRQLDELVIRMDADDSFLQHSRAAAVIAERIGHRLTASVDQAAPLSAESFHCFVDGKVRYDLDTRIGLARALECFRKAHQADNRHPAPMAGISLTSISLAAQSSTERSIELITQARQAAEQTLEHSSNSIDARLATAMLDWQTVEQYAAAETTLRTLVKEAPNNWQVHHQLGLLLLTKGQPEPAIESLRAASLRNPLSLTVRTDIARAYWYSADVDRGLAEAIRLRERFQDHPLAVGLQVDIHEQLGEFEAAAEAHRAVAEIADEAYLEQRGDQLMTLPYGPFGTEMNAAIWQARLPGGISPALISDLADAPLSPMFALLLACHPALGEARQLPGAQEFLARIEAF
jgi:tRNA A-37 threonylcarbamoyl transferase component Bud32/tetratricopeptide (TPR) repeat protein